MGARRRGGQDPIPLGIWAKSDNSGVLLLLLLLLLLLMAEMEFRRMVCWPKRAYIGISGSKMTILRQAYYGDSERNFRVFEATLL